jgi:hypothetical protein
MEEKYYKRYYYLGYLFVEPTQGSEGYGHYEDYALCSGTTPLEVVTDYFEKAKELYEEIAYSDFNKDNIIVKENGEFYYNDYFNFYFIQLPNNCYLAQPLDIITKNERKNNNSAQFYDYTSKLHKEEFVQEFFNNDTRHASCYCSKCFHKLGDIEFKQAYFAKVQSKNISSEKLDTIIPPVPMFENFMIECQNCSPDTPTKHIVLDYNIGKVIQLLNQLGIETKYSCESHLNATGFVQPYILFCNDVSNYFDFDNKLLKWWRIEESTPSGSTDVLSKLYIDSEAPISYIQGGIYIDDLYKYIEIFVVNKLR